MRGISLLAQTNEQQMPLFVALAIFFAVGAVMVGLGVYALNTGEAILPARFRLLMRLFGITSLKGRGARVVGTGQCIAGGMMILASATGPFWAGALSERTEQVLDVSPELDSIAAPEKPSHASNRLPGMAPPAPGPVHPPTNPEITNSAPFASRADPVTSGQLERAQADNGPEPLPPLSAPAVPLPLIPHTADRIARSERAGTEQGEAFEQLAPPSGILVGIRAAKGPSFGGALQGIQPIFQVGAAYELGPACGNMNGEQVEAIAPPGYAVGAADVRAGLVVNALRLSFYRVAEDRLQPAEVVTSPWLGSEGGSEIRLDIGGQFVAGVFGTTQGNNLLSLGLSFVRRQLGSPELPFPRFAYAASRVRGSNQLGNTGGRPFTDRAPEGGLLVGFRLFKGKNWGGALSAIQPIYQIENQYIPGERHGSAAGTEIEILARPGYVVGAIRVRSGLVLDAVQIVFVRLKGTTPDQKDSYESEWIGSEGGSPQGVLGDGRPLVGVLGTYEEDLQGLGVFGIDRLRVDRTKSQ